MREVLGFDVGDSEDEVFWRGFLTSLRKRGLSPVCAWSSPTSMPGWWRRSSAGACRVPPTSVAECILPGTYWPACPSPSKKWWPAAFRTVFAYVVGR